MVQCNIDAKGRAYRMASGVVVGAAGVVLFLLASLQRLSGGWVVPLGIVLVVCGAFQIYEGWAGWCALRAMGVRTKY